MRPLRIGKLRFGTNDVDVIVALKGLYEKYAECTPTEFARPARTLEDIKNFKATEFRQFLLYVVVRLLYGIVFMKLTYEHFLCLSLAYRIISSSDFNANDGLKKADELLRWFVITNQL